MAPFCSYHAEGTRGAPRNDRGEQGKILGGEIPSIIFGTSGLRGHGSRFIDFSML